MKLSSIIKSVILLAQRNFSFCAHRDDSQYHDTEDCGNFQALLDFRIDSSDEILKEHFSTALCNATLRSKATQNEIISCCSDFINEEIIDDIKAAKFYSILADEVSDCSNREQMPLVLR